MLDVLKEPARRIMNNADMVYTDKIINSIIKGQLAYYNITDKRFKTGDTSLNMFRLHIVDPYKVIRTAIANAVSIARLLLQTALIITKE
jgi:chaperonin GroEL (HSP60 family)